MPAESQEIGILYPGPRFEMAAPLARITDMRFDVDGTLVGKESADLPSQRFIDTAQAAEGIVRLSLITARPLNQVRHIIEAIGATGHSVLGNGAQILNGETGEIVEERTLDQEVCGSLLEELAGSGLTCWANDDGIDYFAKRLDSGLIVYERQRDVRDKASERIGASDYTPRKPFSIVVKELTAEQQLYVETMVANCGDENATSLIVDQNETSHGMRYDVLITHRSSNKRDSLPRASQRDKAELKETAIVGDGRNDEVALDLISKAGGVAFAMLNGDLSTLLASTHLAPEQRRDGARHALQAVLQAKGIIVL